ncbi:MAG: hypothetical protein ACM3YE_16555 [Bacteroidota bacterium]
MFDSGPVMLPDEFNNREKELQLYKSLSNLNDALEFMEQDGNGIKMRVIAKYFCGEFPFDIGYVLVSKYDDRKFLVTKIDPPNGYLWLGAWED